MVFCHYSLVLFIASFDILVNAAFLKLFTFSSVTMSNKSYV
jgi:hypothetical protein